MVLILCTLQIPVIDKESIIFITSLSKLGWGEHFLFFYVASNMSR